jgi:hypothetical protein
LSGVVTGLPEAKPDIRSAMTSQVSVKPFLFASSLHLGISEKTSTLARHSGPKPFASTSFAANIVCAFNVHEAFAIQSLPDLTQSEGFTGDKTGGDEGLPISVDTVMLQSAVPPIRLAAREHCGRTGPTGADSQLLPVPPGPESVAMKNAEGSEGQATSAFHEFFWRLQDDGVIGVSAGLPVTGSAEPSTVTSQVIPSAFLTKETEHEGAEGRVTGGMAFSS